MCQLSHEGMLPVQAAASAAVAGITACFQLLSDTGTPRLHALLATVLDSCAQGCCTATAVSTPTMLPLSPVEHGVVCLSVLLLQSKC
jgi:hypothetical protein